jgi:hypothetical protein
VICVLNLQKDSDKSANVRVSTHHSAERGYNLATS